MNGAGTFDFTYEELKLNFTVFISFINFTFDFTYEELKPDQRNLPLLYGHPFDFTYEELKLRSIAECRDPFFNF